MTARYVLLRIEDDQEADDLLRDLALYPHAPLLSPVQENTVSVEVVPGLDVGDEHRSFLPGDPHGLDLETAIGWSYERGAQLAAEWETAL